MKFLFLLAEPLKILNGLGGVTCKFRKFISSKPEFFDLLRCGLQLFLIMSKTSVLLIRRRPAMMRTGVRSDPRDGSRRCAGYLKGSLQPTTKPDLVAKTLQQHHPSEVSQMSLWEGKTQCSQGLRHGSRTIARRFSPCTQTPLKVNFVCRAIYSLRSAKILCLAKILVPSSRIIEVHNSHFVTASRDPPTPGPPSRPG